MSQWTHVIGAIQCQPMSDKRVAEALGTPWSFEEVWEGTFEDKKKIGPQVPEGSEGSVQYYITHHESEKYRVVGEGTSIAIEGDLRNYGEDLEDVKEVVDWFVKGCNTLGARLGILTIDVEFGPLVIVQWDWDLQHASIQQIARGNFDTAYQELFGIISMLQ